MQISEGARSRFGPKAERSFSNCKSRFAAVVAKRSASPQRGAFGFDDGRHAMHEIEDEHQIGRKIPLRFSSHGASMDSEGDVPRGRRFYGRRTADADRELTDAENQAAPSAVSRCVRRGISFVEPSASVPGALQV